MSKRSFYDYQVARFGLLLGWGSGNALVGTALALLRSEPGPRNFWLMNAAWGAINAVIAWAGQNGARTRARKLESDEAKVQAEAAKMQRLLLINVPLDVVYMLSSLWLTRKKEDRWRGMGQSVIVQGAWLFLYDSILAWEVGRRWKK